MKAIWQSIKAFFKKKEPTIVQEEAKPLRRRLADGLRTALFGAEIANRKPQPPRNWRAELYELFIEYNLNIKGFDTNGLTEKLTIAWLTTSARAARARSRYSWGPYGLFSNCYGSAETFRAAVKVECGAWAMGVGFWGWLLWPGGVYFWLPLILIGLGVIVWFYPQVDFWDISYEIWVTPSTWKDRVREHRAISDATALPPAIQQALQLKILPADAYAYFLSPDVKWLHRRSAFTANPEWLSLQRRVKINLIAQALTDALPLRNVDEERYFPIVIEEEKFDFWGGIEEILLLDEARSPNGQCEFFISFSFWAPRTIRTRSIYPGYWGPLKLLKWPYFNSGSFIRELLAGLCGWLCALALGVLLMSIKAGLTYWLWYLGFTLLFFVSLMALLLLRRNVENWRAHSLFEAIPPAYPHNDYGARRRYRWFQKTRAKKWIKLNFILFWIFIILVI